MSRPRRRLPIGAEVQPDGGTHFRVWAPAPQEVLLIVQHEDGGEAEVALGREPAGYYSALVSRAGVGMRYRYRLDGRPFADPASRFQPDGPFGPSEVVDPARYAWTDAGWRGLALQGQVLYEMHVGTFTQEGTWQSAMCRLPHLVETGITTIEVMPVADFPGRFGWGYDGVLLYAPTRLYGTPDDFRAFVDRAHALGLGVMLDVVYNHFGPSGSVVRDYSPAYFSRTYDNNEWGDALNFDGQCSAPVREFFVQNAGYWIDEFHLDGLRLDAIQSIHDASSEHLVAAVTSRARVAAGDRTIIVVAENERQESWVARPADDGGYGLDGMWNDDFHHSAVVAVTGRSEAYYSDHRGAPQEFISAAKYGFLFQGQRYAWQNQPRGSRSDGLPPAAFVVFTENHDQVANSGDGLRMHARTSPGRYRALTALTLLFPGTPMLFQGQEFGASSPFLFFADHEGDLAVAVRNGRAEFMKQFPSFASPETQAQLPVPDDLDTFERCKLHWDERDLHVTHVRLHQDLIALRRTDVAFRRQKAGAVDGAVLASEAFVLRYAAAAVEDERLLVINFGLDVTTGSFADPLVAPPQGHTWRVRWSSEDLLYGGVGVPPIADAEGWRIPGHSATVLAPTQCPGGSERTRPTGERDGGIEQTDLDLVRELQWQPTEEGQRSLASKEWLVTNGVGGYSSGTVSGALTRRYHGLLVAALPTPFGRTVMFNYIWERLRWPDGRTASLHTVIDTHDGREFDTSRYLVGFRLEAGLPVWTYEIEGVRFEKRVLMPYRQNTTHINYRLLSAEPVRLELRPYVAFRLHEAPVNHPVAAPYALHALGDQFEIAPGGNLPSLRLFLHGAEKAFTVLPETFEQATYALEQNRGYECCGDLWSPGYFRLTLAPETPGTLIGSTESWEMIGALNPRELPHAEGQRRSRLLDYAKRVPRTGMPAELVLAADQFIILPAGRIEEAVRARAMGDEVRTVIAGYHWFTDWGRDTMISLEGLALCTGREREAGYILRTFGHYVRDGLIPNMFPEGTKEGLYHTADATLWFFHAIHRYLVTTGDRATLRQLMPKLKSIYEHHITGTRFGIGVDAADGLLRQGQEGYQLTWMDAKVDDWVVTPRRGKAVEINALWYNALTLLANWLREEGDPMAPQVDESAERARDSFNRRFWYDEGGYLYDVVDGEQGDDPACRPNQLFSISLDHPVLVQGRWRQVFDVVDQRLLTPVGLRSLAPGHRDYKPQYYGDLRARDAAYHQGTVWGWLAGPFVDAWLKVYPGDKAGARKCIEGFAAHLSDGGIGTLSEVFDAEEPFTPRGCIAQAWSVAEVLRAWIATEP